MPASPAPRPESELHRLGAGSPTNRDFTTTTRHYSGLRQAGYTARAGTISKTGWLRAAAMKSARGASGGTEKVRRRTNPRSGNARRGANTSFSTAPAVSGGNSTTEMGRRVRPRVSKPSRAARRLRTQLELSWRCVETRKLRPLRSNRSTGVVRSSPDLRPRTVSSTIGPMGRPARRSPLRIQVTARKSLWPRVGPWWGDAAWAGADMGLITGWYTRRTRIGKGALGTSVYASSGQAR
jgi:hypothetical protein